MKQLDYYFWGDAQGGSALQDSRRMSDVDERGLYDTVGQEQQPFINTQEHPTSSWLHLLLYLRIMESPVSHWVRVATFSGCCNQHFTSCYKFSLAFYNAAFHQAVLCFKKLRPYEKLTWDSSICCCFYSSKECRVFCLSVAGIESQSLFWAKRISCRGKFSACILTLKLNMNDVWHRINSGNIFIFLTWFYLVTKEL